MVHGLVGREGAKGKLRRRRKRDRGTVRCGSVIDCAGTCTITEGWSHVSGLNSPFARYNGSDVAVGLDLITRDCLWQTEARGRRGEALSEAPYIAELPLMAAQECEFGDMPRNLI